MKNRHPLAGIFWKQKTKQKKWVPAVIPASFFLSTVVDSLCTSWKEFKKKRNAHVELWALTTCAFEDPARAWVDVFNGSVCRSQARRISGLAGWAIKESYPDRCHASVVRCLLLSFQFLHFFSPSIFLASSWPISFFESPRNSTSLTFKRFFTVGSSKISTAPLFVGRRGFLVNFLVRLTIAGSWYLKKVEYSFPPHTPIDRLGPSPSPRNLSKNASAVGQIIPSLDRFVCLARLFRHRRPIGSSVNIFQ